MLLVGYVYGVSHSVKGKRLIIGSCYSVIIVLYLVFLYYTIENEKFGYGCAG